MPHMDVPMPRAQEAQERVRVRPWMAAAAAHATHREVGSVAAGRSRERPAYTPSLEIKKGPVEDRALDWWAVPGSNGGPTD